jgi:hypothetical protein
MSSEGEGCAHVGIAPEGWLWLAGVLLLFGAPRPLSAADEFARAPTREPESVAAGPSNGRALETQEPPDAATAPRPHSRLPVERGRDFGSAWESQVTVDPPTRPGPGGEGVGPQL